MYGNTNPSMMNSAFYQMMLAQMQGSGGVSGPAPSGLPNMSPQIAQQHQPTSNISQVPQQQQRVAPNPQGAVGGAVQAGNNIQSLYGMGNKAYNGVSGMFGGNTPPPAQGGNPNAAPGAPVANNAAGNQYLQNTPGMQAGAPQIGQAPMQGMSGPAAQVQGSNTQPFFGGMSQGASPMTSMYGAPGSVGAAGTSQGTLANFSASPTSGMFGSMGATGAGAGTTFGSAAGGLGGASATGATGSAATGAAADSSSSMPSWLSSILDAL